MLPNAESIPALFAHRELGSLLDVDDGARLAGLAVEEGEPAGDASGLENAGKIMFGIPRALDNQIAVKLDALAAGVPNTLPVNGGT